MTIERVSLAAACRLLAEGYDYLDVRSELEFAAGHPPNAYNIPISLVGEAALEPNPHFLCVVRNTFQLTHRLLVGCQSGGRSQQAAQRLEAAGFCALVELRTGFDGCRDAFGRREPGWQRAAKPIEVGDGAHRGYAALLARTPLQVTPG